VNPSRGPTPPNTVGGETPTSQLPSEPWVGRWYAYSLPAYYYAVRAVHRKKSLEIEPKDILDEALRG